MQRPLLYVAFQTQTFFFLVIDSVKYIDCLTPLHTEPVTSSFEAESANIILWEKNLKNKQSFSLQNPVGELGPQGRTGRGTWVCLQIRLLPVTCQPADGGDWDELGSQQVLIAMVK